MTKPLTARQLLNFLLEQDRQLVDLDAVTITYRTGLDDVVPVHDVEEDLFDRETNKVLETIVLITDDLALD